MPDDLDPGTGLTIFKGDLNYRRLVGDCYWEPGVSFQEAVSYLPGPAVALRILKSEVLVGARVDPAERVTGAHALIQMYQP
jgi:hypothetical protein